MMNLESGVVSSVSFKQCAKFDLKRITITYH